MSSPQKLTRRPLLTSTLITAAFLVALVLLAVVGAATGSETGVEWVGIAGRSLVGLLALLAMRRYGVAPSTGIAPPSVAWLLAAISGVYLAAFYPWLFTGSWLPAAVGAIVLLVGLHGLVAGAAEEFVFRGLLLGVLRKQGRSWIGSVAGSLIVSSLFFAVPHALNLLAGSAPFRVAAQVIWAFLLGIVFGIVTLLARSVLPAALLHGGVNAIVHMNRHGVEVDIGAAKAVAMAAAPLPLVLVSLIIVQRRLTPSARRDE